MSAELDQYMKQLEQMEKQKQGIIEKLLADRAKIDEQLQKLGHTQSKGTSKGGRPKGKRDTQKRASKKQQATQ